MSTFSWRSRFQWSWQTILIAILIPLLLSPAVIWLLIVTSGFVLEVSNARGETVILHDSEDFGGRNVALFVKDSKGKQFIEIIEHTDWRGPYMHSVVWTKNQSMVIAYCERPRSVAPYVIAAYDFEKHKKLDDMEISRLESGIVKQPIVSSGSELRKKSSPQRLWEFYDQ